MTMRKKPRILVTAGYYLPGHLAGGPIRSIANIVETLSDDFEWWIVTSDRDLGVRHPYPGIMRDAWNPVGKAMVFYVSPTARGAWRMLRLLRQTPHDLLYLNSFFDPMFSILPAVARKAGLTPRVPLLLAPRGEFSPGALELKHLRKRLYRALSGLFGVCRDAVWQASTDREAADIARVMTPSKRRVHVARDLAAAVPESVPDPDTGNGSLRVCFLSRISRMKNLDYALRVLETVRIPLTFDIYGPMEDPDYWKECEEILKRLPPTVKVAYRGAVAADRVFEVLSRHELLLLPTLGENFGHVLLEAWAAGLTVLTSDRTPWRGLQASGVGWDLPLEDRSAFVRALEAFAGLDAASRVASRRACNAFARRHADDGAAIADNRRMFAAALRAGRDAW